MAYCIFNLKIIFCKSVRGLHSVFYLSLFLRSRQQYFLFIYSKYFKIYIATKLYGWILNNKQKHLKQITYFITYSTIHTFNQVQSFKLECYLVICNFIICLLPFGQVLQNYVSFNMFQIQIYGNVRYIAYCFVSISLLCTRKNFRK